jgi:ABC-2 type transport system ATP-binding protein
MIEFRNVTKTFQKDFWAQPFKALDNVSFKIPQASMVGFLGANGAGKTTSLKILMEFIKPNSGEVLFSSELGGGLFQALSKIGYLPERPYFYPHLTGQEFAELMGQLSNVPRALLKERIKTWSKQLNIDHALNRQIRGYSKGMLQRIGFVTVLLHDPQMLILDEPLSGLDPVGRKEMKDVMRRLNNEGKTVFFSSHIVSDIEETCSDVVVLEDGQCIYNGEIEELLDENRSSGYEFTYSGEPLVSVPFEKLNATSKIWTIRTSESHKNQALKEIIEKGYDLRKVELSKISLEEIIYKIKSQ